MGPPRGGGFFLGGGAPPPPPPPPPRPRSAPARNKTTIMLAVRQIDPRCRTDRHRFLRFPFTLYRNHPLWVPPIRPDAELQLNRDGHLFYEHSGADFFVAERDGKVVGRIAALENRPYKAYPQARAAQFYLFECTDDREVASAVL